MRVYLNVYVLVPVPEEKIHDEGKEIEGCIIYIECLCV
jgi:hypothetical protein